MRGGLVWGGLVPAHRRHVAAGLLLTGLVAGCYLNAFTQGFLLDDMTLIVTNTMIQDLKSLPHLVTGAYFNESGEVGYRPLTTLSFFVDYRLWGLNPFGFHLTNLLLHLVTTLLVYALFTRLLARWDAALAGAAFFAAHPVLTESVSYIAPRGTALAAALVLLALCCLLWSERDPGGSRRWLRVAAGLTAYGLALLAKESAAAFAPLLLLSDWAGGRLNRSRLPVYAMVALLTLGYLVLRFGVMYFPEPRIFPPFHERLLTWPYATWLHLLVLALPIELSAEYTVPIPVSAWDPMVVFPVAGLAVLGLVFLWLWYREERLGCLGVGWIIAALGPVSNLVPFLAVGFPPVGERYLYLPAVGWALLLTLALTRLRSRAVAGGLAAALLVTYGGLTFQRSLVWRDDVMLLEDTARKAPHSPWIHLRLGTAYEERGALTQALQEYTWAGSLLSRYPAPYVMPYHSAGWIYLRQGRLARAAHQFRQIVQLNPHDALALARLGVVFHRQGRFERAAELYQAALRETPKEAEVWANLGAASVALGRRTEALSALEAARRLNPSEAVIHNNLGTLYAEAGRLPEAVAAYQEALRLNPNFAGAHENLGALYARQGRRAEAEVEYSAARRAGAR